MQNVSYVEKWVICPRNAQTILVDCILMEAAVMNVGQWNTCRRIVQNFRKSKVSVN